jgi:hypothetical protein
MSDNNDEGKKKMPIGLRVAIFLMFLIAVFFLPTTIIFSVCLVPTLVAAIVDNHAQKTAWLTVGAMNVAGTVPVWVSLIESGHYSMLDPARAIPAAFQLVIQPVNIIIAYGGACIGSIIYYKVTPFIAAIVQSKNENRLRDIDKRQKALIRKWGEGVYKTN